MKDVLFWTFVITFGIIFMLLGMIELLIVATQGIVIFPKLLIACLFIAIGVFIWIWETRV